MKLAVLPCMVVCIYWGEPAPAPHSRVLKMSICSML